MPPKVSAQGGGAGVCLLGRGTDRPSQGVGSAMGFEDAPEKFAVGKEGLAVASLSSGFRACLPGFEPVFLFFSLSKNC